MSKLHKIGLYALVGGLIFADIFLRVSKMGIFACCLILLQLKRSIAIVGGFMETIAESFIDLLLTLAAFMLLVIEELQGPEIHQKSELHKKYSSLVAGVLEDIFKNLEEQNLGRPENEGDSINATSKHRFLSALQHYFQRRDRDAFATVV